MKTLNEPTLQLGDIVLSTTPELISKGIRVVTKSEISHAMLYVEAYSLIDSTGDGVHARNTQRTLWKDQCQVHVLRLKHGLSDEQLQRVVNYARGLVGTQYSVFEAARSITKKRGTNSRKQFCSRLVAQAYAAAGINLVKSPDYCTPEDLRKSPLLEEVPSATHAVSQAYVEAIKEIVDTTELMRTTTNKLLELARAKDNQIEHLSDIDAHLIRHPEDDAYFARAYRESGYLEIKDIEFEKNRWQYDLQSMIDEQVPSEVKKNYCEMVLLDGEKGLQRYGANEAGYAIYAREHALETFRLLHELYAQLYDLQLRRRNVAKEWLAQHEPTLLEKCRHQLALTPHSPEWFDALEAWNPHQAQQTRQMIRLSGNYLACSVCGDEPTRDYRLIGHDVPEGAVATLRLCDDCWRIRRDMYGESFSLMDEGCE